MFAKEKKTVKKKHKNNKKKRLPPPFSSKPRKQPGPVRARRGPHRRVGPPPRLDVILIRLRVVRPARLGEELFDLRNVVLHDDEPLLRRFAPPGL